MRRRTGLGDRSLSAEQLVAIGDRLQRTEASNEVFHHALNQQGYTAVDYFRARLWLRQGKPADYVWDDAAASTHPNRGLTR